MRPRQPASPWPPTTVLLLPVGTAVFQVVGTFGAASDEPDSRAIDALAILLVLLGPLALILRHRLPLVVAGVALASTDLYIGLGYPYGPVFFSGVFALFAAMQSGRRRASLLVAAAGYAGFVLATVLDPYGEPAPGIVGTLAGAAAWLSVVLAVSEVIRVQRERAADRDRAVDEEEQRRVGEQRLELAQELHDVLAHNISLINVQASVALHLLDEQPERARPALEAVKEASSESLRELRTALDVLRRGEAAPRSPLPRLADLDALVAGVRAGGLDVHFDGVALPATLPPAVELATYRIVQEALTNVTRHAHARSVRVCTRATEEAVTLEVVDDGIGAGSAAGDGPAGNGITGMRERASALGEPWKQVPPPVAASG